MEDLLNVNVDELDEAQLRDYVKAANQVRAVAQVRRSRLKQESDKLSGKKTKPTIDINSLL